jgi:hypothetical protein
MGKHGRPDSGHGGGHDRSHDGSHGGGGHRSDGPWRQGRPPGMGYGAPGHDVYSRLPRKLPVAVVLIGLVVWTAIAWGAYALVDPLLGWVESSTGTLVESGKSLATTAGAGKEVGSLIETAGGSSGKIIGWLRVLLKPVIVVVWALGVLALLAAPLILRSIGNRLFGRRH